MTSPLTAGTDDLADLPLGTALIDAWDGIAPVTGDPGKLGGWTVTPPALKRGTALRPAPVDERVASSSKVGWGLILPELRGVSAAVQATAADAPLALQKLLAFRNGKVLRYRAGQKSGSFALRDPAADADIPLISPPMGTGPKQLPKYLLIYGPPSSIAWDVQFHLNTLRSVGRLDLTGDALDNYVNAAVTDWAGSAADYRAPVVWAVDHGGVNDITTLMRRTVAEPLQLAFRNDGEMTGLAYLNGAQSPALLGGLLDALATNKPAVVVTSSHGQTGPLADLDQLRLNLGAPVDQQFHALTSADTLAAWQPDGAIWFAQACCSAGSNGPSVYQGLFPAEGDVGKVLFGVAAAGATISPLPRALLGAEKPLRAFIGRVEPTFSWTLEHPQINAPLTADLVKSVYDRLCDATPVGMAMEPFFKPISTILQLYLKATKVYNDEVGPVGAAGLSRALYYKVSSYDRAGLVILGDPAAAIPLPG